MEAITGMFVAVAICAMGTIIVIMLIKAYQTKLKTSQNRELEKLTKELLITNQQLLQMQNQMATDILEVKEQLQTKQQQKEIAGG
ncbi:hypothetical protein [Alkalihalobacillus sp. LMS39]|uniref:hypothetical protein n=1 Tax=Alkalihalobacillus sp. LMS39 TaxID=2924032 RepID=UPI001FB209BE|nr:hypothetical protein [Alkalihalobacillus sp. LMS39]UOE93709.1 hypothetical protein MM271_21420 [Alkalihalobacillus sp. LMS39]